MSANIYHAHEQLATVILRPLSAKTGNSYYTKCWAKETLHMDDPIRTIEGPKKCEVHFTIDKYCIVSEGRIHFVLSHRIILTFQLKAF